MEQILKMEQAFYTKAFQICKDEHTAKDVVQETYLWAIENNIYEVKDVSEQLVKLALRQLNKKEIFIASSGGDEEYESFGSSIIRKVEAKTALIPVEIKEKELQKFEVDESLLVKKSHSSKSFLNFQAARAYVRSVGIKCHKDWIKWAASSERPWFIHTAPSQYYKGEFISWIDFLGNGYNEFVTYEEAKSVVQNFLVPKGVSSRKKWRENIALIPSNVPKAPDHYYKKCGWDGWNGFFGVKERARFIGDGLYAYEEAKKYVQEHLVPIGIINTNTWRNNTDKIPDFLPYDPWTTYKNKGWTTPKDFFGVEAGRNGLFEKRKIPPYGEAREWARLNLRPCGITSKTKFLKYINGNFEGDNLPIYPTNFVRDPSSYYNAKKTWKGWADFLGTFNKSYKELSKEMVPYEVLSQWMKKNIPHIKFNNVKWLHYLKRTQKYEHLPRPDFKLPSSPHSSYINKGWVSWSDFNDYTSFRKKGSKVKLLFNLVNGEFEGDGLEIKSRKGISSIINAYRQNHKNFSVYLSFEDACSYVKNVLVPLGIFQIKLLEDMKKANNYPLFLPTQPHVYYKKEWKGYDYFFGYTNESVKRIEGLTEKERRAKSTKISFNEARKWIHDNLPQEWRGQKEFKKYPDLPLNIPKNPDAYYKGEFKGYSDWFGRPTPTMGERGKKEFITFEDAKKVLSIHKVYTQKEYIIRCKKIHKKLPSEPKKIYADKWTDWDNYLPKRPY